MKKCCKGPSLSEVSPIPPVVPYHDPLLIPFADVIGKRFQRMQEVLADITAETSGSLYEFCDYHHYFGLHFDKGHWIFREWAPHATRIYIICEETGWEKDPAFLLTQIDASGIFQGVFPKNTFRHRSLYRLRILWPGGEGDRIPTAARRVVQDSHTLIFNAQVWHPETPYVFEHPSCPLRQEPLLIYEAHTGMALEEERIGTYAEFVRHILPKIDASGYNAIQLMAVPEHPYYGSFGYHVSSFFAPSSRFGTPDEFRSLIDSAHARGIRVLIDIIHSHCVKNEVEGLSRFDGTLHQFFHDGPAGYHPLWDSRCFDYGKRMVQKFLLSNIRYWMEEFKVDGFRFDGVTSIIFKDHGIGRSFQSYQDYFKEDVDEEALAYLYLVNTLVHDINPDAVSIAEDVSGYPGLAAPLSEKGIGFDYRFAMGVPDFWIRLLKEYEDEKWPLGTLWHELTTRRKEEKTISYAESHDQALVGDKTLMMHLMGDDIYTAMSMTNPNIRTIRGVALHKMIRLITSATAGSGYLNFMGNEFGHPEWIDFPSQRNNWSYRHARRQWSLKYDLNLFYSALFEFDRQMVALIKKTDLLDGSFADLVYLHEEDRVIAFKRKQLIFVFNFNSRHSFKDYQFDVAPGKYQMIFDTDAPHFGGQSRLIPDQVHFTRFDPSVSGMRNMISLYLPTRTALILQPDK